MKSALCGFLAIMALTVGICGKIPQAHALTNIIEVKVAAIRTDGDFKAPGATGSTNVYWYDHTQTYMGHTTVNWTADTNAAIDFFVPVPNGAVYCSMAALSSSYDPTNYLWNTTSGVESTVTFIITAYPTYTVDNGMINAVFNHK